MTDLTMTFLGTSAAIPTLKRGLSALTIQRGGDLLLFDAGEGTQRQMMKFTGMKAPAAIFLTHAHGDHWTGLPGLLSTLAMQDHDAPLPIFMPPTMLNKVNGALELMGAKAPFVHLVGLAPGETHDMFAPGGETYTISPFPTKHSHGSQGYIFEEPERPGKFDPYLAQQAGIQPGPDFKRLQNGETVKGLAPEDVIGPPRRGRKIVVTGDTAPIQGTAISAVGADVLVHEATFENDSEARARKTKHSTGADAGRVAAQAGGVDRLVLTHFSPRSNPTETVRQAAAHFSPVQGAHDGMKINVPLPV